MKISIIGGGITGLTTALALRKKGIEATVYEQSEQLSEIGAGIWLQPNALKVLNWLGIESELCEVGNQLDLMEITNSKMKPIKNIDERSLLEISGFKTLAIHRAHLQNILMNKVREGGNIKMASKYISHEQINDKLIIEFKDEKVETDIILACDGIHSKVRKNIFPESSLRNTNQLCWRGISDYELDPELVSKGREMWGKNKRFGFSAIGKDKVYWFAVINDKEEFHKIDNTEIINLFSDFHPAVKNIISHTTFIHETVLQDLKRMKKWHNKNVCLLGDAAHATTPNMGQGACQGIEDAYYIAELISKNDDVETVFNIFESKRRKKVDYVVNNSWIFGKLAHHSVGQKLMKLIMKLTPEKVLKKQMKELYRVDGL